MSPISPRVAAEALLAAAKWAKGQLAAGHQRSADVPLRGPAVSALRMAISIACSIIVSSACQATRSGSWAERRSTGEQKYYVSNLPADVSLKMLARNDQGQMGL